MLRSDSKPPFGTFDPQSEVDVTARNLPHWFQPGVAMFITFRTADSMPKAVIARLWEEIRGWLAERKLDPRILDDPSAEDTLPRDLRRAYLKFKNQGWLRSLDECHGECVLRRPELARIVRDSLLFFNEERYDVDSFVVMPKHVHLLVQFRPPTELATQTKSWLRYSAGEINKALGRKGKFWQSEPFDHLVGSAEQFEYLRKYIADNPRKANLPAGDYLLWP